jgi:hypothetical protein
LPLVQDGKGLVLLVEMKSDKIRCQEEVSLVE